MKASAGLADSADGPGLQSGFDALDARLDGFLDLEVPDPHNRPTGRFQLGVHSFVACPVLADLLVPKFAGLAPVVLRVSVPKRPIHKDSDSAADERKIRSPWHLRRVAPIA